MASPTGDCISDLLERVRKALEPQFHIERELGAGGMGVVYEAIEKALERRVAVKVLRPEMATAAAAARLMREARLLAKLQHPNVVSIHQVGETDGLFWFTMDLIPGETLARRLERGPLSPSETLRLARDLLKALGAAHARDVVHRDVKPSNIFLNDGHAMLADFGIARSLADSSSDATRTQQTVGTPAYMAPEQRSGDPVSPATDLYSLGAVLYQCLTGRRWPQMQIPESGDWSGVPRHLVFTLQRALALAPDDRVQTVQAFVAGLSRPHVRWHWVAAVAAVALVVAIVFRQIWLPDPPQHGIAGPRKRMAWRTWHQAESLYLHGSWRTAQKAYQKVLEVDSTCLGCELRLIDTDRWLERRSDSSRLGRLVRGIDRFDPSWQTVIRAINAPAPLRLGLLETLVNNDREFWPGRYYLGEELFNRGPLLGKPRRDAIDALEQVSRMEPRFAAVWYDLTIARVAEGDSAGAAIGLAQIMQQPPVEGLAQAQRLLAGLAFAFRFTKDGLAQWERVRGDQKLYALPELAAGPRVLNGLGTPKGAVELGEAFETVEQLRRLQRSGLIAQVVGLTALGRPMQARKVGDRLITAFPGVESAAMVRAFIAAMTLFDASSTRAEVQAAVQQLEPLTQRFQPLAVRSEAMWLSAVGAVRRRDPTTASQLARALAADSISAAATLIQALLMAEDGEPDGALLLTESLARDPGAWDRPQESPLLRAALKLSRGEWYARMMVPDRVRSELRWHQHFNLPDYPIDNPVTAEGDWAFGTLAAWRQARLLDFGTRDNQLCDSYRMVVERWGYGEDRYRARADSARARIAALGCRGNP